MEETEYIGVEATAEFFAQKKKEQRWFVATQIVSTLIKPLPYGLRKKIYDFHMEKAVRATCPPEFVFPMLASLKFGDLAYDKVQPRKVRS